MQCNVCQEARPNENINVDDKSHVCTRCKADKGTPKKISVENNMDPGSVPPELNELTQCEEMLKARPFPVIQVYVRKGHNTISYKEHVLTVPHNVQNVANILPQFPENIFVIVFVVKGRNNTGPAKCISKWERVHSFWWKPFLLVEAIVFINIIYTSCVDQVY